MAFSDLGQGVWFGGEGTGYVGLALTADIHLREDIHLLAAPGQWPSPRPRILGAER